MLDVSRLSAAYGRARILFDLSFRVKAGEVLVLLGRNGAGKSTALKSLIGLMPSRAGEIVFAGRRIDALRPYQIARLGLGFVPEDRRIFPDLTVRENLEVGRQPRRPDAPHWTPERLFELFPNLAPLQERLGARMSGGEQQMLAIARTLMGNPRAVLLDEPSEGLAPVIVDQLTRVLLDLKREGMAVLLCEQNLRFARGVADRACLLASGHLRRSGTMDEITAGDLAL